MYNICCTITVYAVRNKRQERYQEEEGLATTDEDVQQAALALVRLRQTYNLDLGALIRYFIFASHGIFSEFGWFYLQIIGTFY